MFSASVGCCPHPLLEGATSSTNRGLITEPVRLGWCGVNHFGSTHFSRTVHCFVIPGETICDGSQGMERRRNTGRMVRGHVAPTAVSPVAERQGTGKGKTSEVTCQLCEGVLASRCPSHVRQSDGPRTPQSGRSAGGHFQQDHQVAVSSAVLGEDDTQESANAGRATCGRPHRANPEIHRTCEETARSAQDECEKELSAEKTSVKIALRGRASDSPTSRFSDGGATSPTVTGEAQPQLHQQGSVSVTAGPAKRPRRREDFMCSCAEEVIEWISDRQFDIQEEITKGNAAEARLSSLVVQAATRLQQVHTSIVAQFVTAPETSSFAQEAR